MENQGIIRVAMNLTTQEQKDTWNVVRAHYGKEFSNSAVLFDLVRIKCYEANGQISNRDRFDAIMKEIAELKKIAQNILDEMEQENEQAI